MSEPKPAFQADFATIAGIVLAAGCIIGGLVLEGGAVADLGQWTAALIVLGGTMGAVLVSTPLETLAAAARRLPSLLLARKQPYGQVVDDLVRISEHARRAGIASLEEDAAAAEDTFLGKALNLAADGTDLREIREIMQLQIEVEQDRADEEIRVWESAGGYAPTIGIIGAVLGLIQVMKHLDHLTEVGHGIAVAFISTVYGVASANLLFLPAAGKLRARLREVSQLHDLMLEGVISVAEGMNPRLIRIKLEAFLDTRPAPSPRETPARPVKAARFAARA